MQYESGYVGQALSEGEEGSMGQGTLCLGQDRAGSLEELYASIHGALSQGGRERGRHGSWCLMRRPEWNWLATGIVCDAWWQIERRASWTVGAGAHPYMALPCSFWRQDVPVPCLLTQVLW